MPTISLHIGLPHSGSTTIRHLLGENRETLREFGVHVPSSFGRRSHGKLAVYAMREDRIDERRLRLDIRDAAGVRAFRETFAAAVAADFAAASDAKRIVMSAEDLSWDLRDGSEIERLRGLLVRHGEVDRVLIYLRPQSELLVSRHANAVKRGRVGDISLLQGLAERRPYDYRRTLDLWAQSFGEANMVVRLLDPAQFVGGSLHDDVADALALPPEALPVRPPTGNEGLDVQALAYLRLINKHLPTDERSMSDAAHALIDTLRAIRQGPKSTAPGWKLSIWRRLFARGNRAIAEQLFGRESLFRESPSEGRAKLRMLTLDEAMEISAKLWIAREQAIAGDRRVERRKAKTELAKNGVVTALPRPPRTTERPGPAGGAARAARRERPLSQRFSAERASPAPALPAAPTQDLDEANFCELLADAAFETDAWTPGEGWTVADGIATHEPTEKSTALKQTLAKPLLPGARYRVEFRVTDISSGTVSFRLTRGAPVNGTLRDAVGTYVEEAVATSRHPVFAIIGSDDFVGSVAEPSLTRVPREAATMAPALDAGDEETPVAIEGAAPESPQAAAPRPLEPVGHQG